MFTYLAWLWVIEFLENGMRAFICGGIHFRGHNLCTKGIIGSQNKLSFQRIIEWCKLRWTSVEIIPTKFLSNFLKQSIMGGLQTSEHDTLGKRQLFQPGVTREEHWQSGAMNYEATPPTISSKGLGKPSTNIGFF